MQPMSPPHLIPATLCPSLIQALKPFPLSMDPPLKPFALSTDSD
jgi:hypothetical protein